MSVLIVTMPGDYHAHAVKWAIEQLGGRCALLYPLDLAGGAEWTFDSNRGVLTVRYGGDTQHYALEQFKTVWMRRPGGIYPQEQLSDVDERAIAEEEFSILAGGFFTAVEDTCFRVNPFMSTRKAGVKPYQFSVAVKVGLRMPETLISNDSTEICDFFDRLGGYVVYKPLRSAVWPASAQSIVTVPTTLITDKSLLLSADLRSAPGIYQEKIDKVAEVRATFMGRSVFAWKKHFEGRADLDIDWRMMNTGAIHTKHELPADILEKSYDLMKRLDIVFGCFDYAIDKDGNYHFLEVNPQGQFLWGDYFGAWQNQLEAMAEFLLSGDRDFVYSESNRINNYQYADMGIFERDVEEESRRHYGNVMTFHCNRVSVPVKLNYALPTVGYAAVRKAEAPEAELARSS